MFSRPFPSPLPVAGLLLLLLLAACGGGSSDAAETGQGAGAPAGDAVIQRELRDLITAVSPLAPTATKSAEMDWFRRRRETLERLRAGSPELGRAALDEYLTRPDALLDVRTALLDVAAHCGPEEAQPLLVELVSTFGEHLGVRKAAARFLALTSPEKAAELLEPIVSTTEGARTYPPMEDLLESWVIAMDALGRDPVEVLAEVSTDIRQEQSTRHFAARQLGEHEGAAGRQALEALLVESLGNNMLRRIAAQSLGATVAKDDLCPVLERVMNNEADPNMLQFLASMLEEFCL